MYQHRRDVYRARLESEGSVVRIPMKTYILILNFSIAYRSSQLGEAHTNEIDMPFIQSNGFIKIDLIYF